MSEMSLIIPGLTPPSVNHYKARGKSGHWYVTDRAQSFKDAVAIFVRGRQVGGSKSEYALAVTVYFGKGQKGDGDNMFKVLADALKDCGCIHSDAAIKDWSMKVRRDWDRPRTEIVISTL